MCGLARIAASILVPTVAPSDLLSLLWDGLLCACLQDGLCLLRDGLCIWVDHGCLDSTNHFVFVSLTILPVLIILHIRGKKTVAFKFKNLKFN